MVTSEREIERKEDATMFMKRNSNKIVSFGLHSEIMKYVNQVE